MKIAIATYAHLTIPAVQGGAVETLIETICRENEKEQQLEIDVFAVNAPYAAEKARLYPHTFFKFYDEVKTPKISTKNVIYKLFKISVPNRNMNRITRLINRKKYDFVVITSINREMKYVFRQIKSPVLWYLHGDPISAIPSKQLSEITKGCAGILTVSDFIKNQIVSVQPECPVLTIPNCTSLQPVPDVEQDQVRKRIRDQWNVDELGRVLLYAGRITPIKGIIELVEAFVNVADSHNKLIIAGSPSNEKEQQYDCEIRKIADERVVFAGYVPHERLNEFFCAADGVAVPSTCLEAAPLSVIEARRCGKKVIAPRIGGIPEYTDDENTIWIPMGENYVQGIETALTIFYSSHTISEKNEKFNEQKYYDDFCTACKIIKNSI